MANLDLAKCWTTGTPPPAQPDAADVSLHGALVAFQMHVCRFLREWLPLAPVVAQGKPGAITFADKKTIASDVEASLRSIGISLVVGLDTGTRAAAALHAIAFDPFTFVINIAESPVTNRGEKGTGITASRAAELVMLCLSGVRLGNGVSAVKSFSVGGEEGSLQTAEVTFQTSYTITPPASLLAD